MKHFIFPIALVFTLVSTFLACEKADMAKANEDLCRSSKCTNGSVCDYNTGLCSDICQNGGESNSSDGTCTCATFFEGPICAEEVRANYIGAYLGSLGIESDSMITGVAVSNRGRNAQDQSFIMEVASSMGQVTFEFDGELSSNTDFKIEKTNVDFTLNPGSSKADLSGSGKFADSTLTLNLTFTTTDSATAGTVVTAGFLGVKVKEQ